MCALLACLNIMLRFGCFMTREHVRPSGTEAHLLAQLIHVSEARVHVAVWTSSVS